MTRPSPPRSVRSSSNRGTARLRLASRNRGCRRGPADLAGRVSLVRERRRRSARSGKRRFAIRRHRPTTPSGGSSAVVSARAAAQVPTARPRSSPENAVPTKARLAGMRNAAAAPGTPRRTTSAPAVGASPQAIDAAANPERPRMNVGRWPNVSPTDPPKRIRGQRSADTHSRPTAMPRTQRPVLTSPSECAVDDGAVDEPEYGRGQHPAWVASSGANR